jgi:hypothetical protein
MAVMGKKECIQIFVEEPPENWEDQESWSSEKNVL